MTRELLLELICPADYTDVCVLIGCENCEVKLNEWLDEYDNQIRSEVIEEVNKKLDELERNCESCYGAKIVEMYADTYEMFRKWLKEQEKY